MVLRRKAVSKTLPMKTLLFWTDEPIAPMRSGASLRNGGIHKLLARHFSVQLIESNLANTVVSPALGFRPHFMWRRSERTLQEIREHVRRGANILWMGKLCFGAHWDD